MATDRGYPWLKVYPLLLDDPRYLRRTDGARALYFELYLLAGKADAGGLVIIGNDIATPGELAFILHREPEQIEAQIEELVKSTLLTLAPDGLVVTRFQEEQGPTQAEKRIAWRERQTKKRSAALIKDEVKSLALEKEEEEAVEVDVDLEVTPVSRVTVPPPLPAAASLNPSDDELLREWHSLTGTQARLELLPAIHQIWTTMGDKPRLRAILKQCSEFWAQLSADKGWAKNNPDVILELFVPGELQNRMDREGYKYNEKTGTYQAYV